MPEFIYILTAEQLSDEKISKNLAFKNYYETEKKEMAEGFIFSEDLAGLQKDTNRTTQINGEYKKGELNSGEYAAFIQEELKVAPKDLANAYSQSLMSMLVHPLNFHTDIGLPRNFEGYNRVDNIYRDNNDGNIYFKTKIEGYKINTPDVAYIHGPVELLYKLEKNRFVLQYAATNSKFIQDAFLGNPIDEAALCKEMENGQMVERMRQTDAIGIKFLSICDQQRIPSLDPRKRKLDDIRSVTGKAVEMWGKGELTNDECKKILSNLLPVANELEKSSSYIMRVIRLFKLVNQDISTALKTTIASVDKVPDIVTKAASNVKRIEQENPTVSPGRRTSHG